MTWDFTTKSGGIWDYPVRGFVVSVVLWSFDRPASFRLMCVAVLLTEPLKHG